jgi:hypothetical protein
MSNMKRDHAIDELCMLKVSAVAPQYLPISAPDHGIFEHREAPAAELRGNAEAKETFLRQILVVVDRERGVVVDRLGAPGKPVAAQFVDSIENLLDFRPDARKVVIVGNIAHAFYLSEGVRAPVRLAERRP